MTHADEARRIVEALDGIPWWKMIDDKIDADVVNAVEATLEVQIAAALAAAERRGIERAADEAENFLVLIGAGWRKFPHNSSDGKARERMCVERIRALLPAAVAEPEPVSDPYKLPAEPAAKSLQDEIGAWGDVTFPNSTQQTIIAHLRSEVNEEIAPDCDPEELADAATLVMQLAHKRKLNLDALVRAKFEKNKRRKWVWDEKAGFSRHVKDAEPAAKCATPCLICGGKKRVCYHADACVASQYPLSGRCIASAGECRMVPPCVVFEVDCPSCLKCANPECVNGEVPSNQGGWMSPVSCPSCGGAR